MTGYIVAEFDADGEMVYMKFWASGTDATTDLNGSAKSIYGVTKAKWTVSSATI